MNCPYGGVWSVAATHAKVKAQSEVLQPLLVIGSTMCRAKDLKVERAAALVYLEFAVELYSEQVKRGCWNNLGQPQVGNSSAHEKNS